MLGVDSSRTSPSETSGAVVYASKNLFGWKDSTAQKWVEILES